MKRADLKALGLAAIVGLWGGWASGAWCQQVLAPPPPTYTAVDANGVDLSSGHYSPSPTSLSLGSDSSGMKFQWTFNEGIGVYGIQSGFGIQYGTNSVDGGIYRSNLDGGVYLALATARYTVSIGEHSYKFDLSPNSLLGDGATLAITGQYSVKLTTTDGTVASYDESSWPLQSDAATMKIQNLTKPNGEVLTYAYTSFVQTNGSNASYSWSRLQSVTSSLGYQVHYEYDPNNVNMPVKIELINLATDFCDPAAYNCSSLGSVDEVDSQIT